MTRTRYRRLMKCFEQARALPEAERSSLIARIQAQDPDLAGELRKLLAKDQTLHDGFDSTNGQPDVTTRNMRARDPRVDIPEPCAGTLIDARYLLEEDVGKGAMGHVFRAFDRACGRDVAVKLLRADLSCDPCHVMRFQREFRAITCIDHPGCVAVYDWGQYGKARYIVMEYVAGGNLDRLVGAPDAVLLPVLGQVAEVLGQVHDRDMIHRDIKPANILLSEDDPPRPKLADFGVVKLMNEPDPQLTASGAVVGTIDYIAPEQLDETAVVGARSDLYSLGCVFYKMWAARPPFMGRSYQRLRDRLSGEAPRLREAAPHVPAALDELVARMLRRDPAERPQHASEVADELAEIASRGGRSAHVAQASWRSETRPSPHGEMGSDLHATAGSG